MPIQLSEQQKTQTGVYTEPSPLWNRLLLLENTVGATKGEI